MPVSKARRAANDKWDRENMATLGCKVKKGDATIFKAYAVEQGKTANTVLRDYVVNCVAGYKTSDGSLNRFVNRAIDEAVERDNGDDIADTVDKGGE